jgi:hypothetical protein
MLGDGLSVQNMNIYNPKRIKYDIDNIKKIMEDKDFIVFHITGNIAPIKKLIGDVKLFHSKSKKDLTEGFYWYSMPEYKEDTKKYPIAYIGFLNDQDKNNFFRILNIEINKNTRWVHYPVPIPNKNKFQHYAITYKINPKYPVYIISKGRWEKRKTSKACEEAGIPYKIVVEPQEYKEYVKVINAKKILILPKKYLGLNQAGIPARNFVWSHAVKSGAEKHWILDDNIDGFYRWNLNHRWKIKSGVLLRLVENYVNRFNNIKQSGLNYRMFYPSRQPRAPVTFNTRVYSCILIDHALDKILNERWRGKYNEDTDLSLRILKSGHATCLFNAFLCGKEPTLSSSGGNTTELYKNGSKEALFKKADSLRKQHPDVARVVERYKRGVHHEVDYSKFKNISLEYKNTTISKKSKEYNMKFINSPEPDNIKGNGFNIQAVEFKRSKWSVLNSKKWLDQQGFIPIKQVHRIGGLLRYILKDPFTYTFHL